jgi:hypothetical protein
MNVKPRYAIRSKTRNSFGKFDYYGNQAILNPHAFDFGFGRFENRNRYSNKRYTQQEAKRVGGIACHSNGSSL